MNSMLRPIVRFVKNSPIHEMKITFLQLLKYLKVDIFHKIIIKIEGVCANTEQFHIFRTFCTLSDNEKNIRV